MSTNSSGKSEVFFVRTGKFITVRNIVSYKNVFDATRLAERLAEIGERENRDFRTDISKIIQLYCTNGGRISNIRTFDPQLRNDIQQWIKIYNIKDRLESKSDPDTVTLSRIASAFPCITVDIQSQGNIVRPVSVDVPEGMKCLQVLPFYEAIHNKEDRSHYINATQYYLVLESMATNKNHKNMSFQEVLDIMHPCMMGSRLGYSLSGCFEKLELLKKWKIYPASSVDKQKIENVSSLFLKESCKPRV